MPAGRDRTLLATDTPSMDVTTRFIGPAPQNPSIQHSAIVLQGWSNGNKAQEVARNLDWPSAQRGPVWPSWPVWKGRKKTHPPNNHPPPVGYTALFCGFRQVGWWGPWSCSQKPADLTHPTHTPNLNFALQCFLARSDMEPHTPGVGLGAGGRCGAVGGTLNFSTWA